MEPAPKRTPLAAIHESLGARMIDFGGWWMPVHYQGILEEHRAVRAQAGLFDISHMGEIFITGPGAEPWLNRMLTNDVSRLSDGEGQYTLLLNERGGVIDDLLCYRLEPDHYLLLVNASTGKVMRLWGKPEQTLTIPTIRVGDVARRYWGEQLGAFDHVDVFMGGPPGGGQA